MHPETVKRPSQTQAGVPLQGAFPPRSVCTELPFITLFG